MYCTSFFTGPIPFTYLSLSRLRDPYTGYSSKVYRNIYQCVVLRYLHFRVFLHPSTALTIGHVNLGVIVSLMTPDRFWEFISNWR